MQCLEIAARPDWQSRAARAGFTYHTAGGQTYWDESRYYRFTLRQIEDDIEQATGRLHALCLELVDRVAASEHLLERLAIPRSAWDVIAASWKRRDPSLYGRFDLSYDGTGPAKLLEYNADTPTSLYEAASFQWFWLEDTIAAGLLPRGADQYNSIHEQLVERFARFRTILPLHFACVRGEAEDEGTTSYLAYCAREAGLTTHELGMLDIRLGRDGVFYDGKNRRIDRLFKLYPWEWMFQEEFAKALPGNQTRFIEPPWKAILSNKGMLALLWEMEPNHPNLLACAIEADGRAAALGTDYVRKPLLSREGANVAIVNDGKFREHAPGTYGTEGYVRQAVASLPVFNGRYGVVGSWVVGDTPCGIGMRDDASAITKNTSRFVPHAIVD
jgi:glutathionylspermidine synthase